MPGELRIKGGDNVRLLKVEADHEGWTVVTVALMGACRFAAEVSATPLTAPAQREDDDEDWK